MTTADKNEAKGRHHGGVLCGAQFADAATLEARARKVSYGLRALGVGPGDCVALLMRNDIAFLEVSYGVMRLGAYVVPINWRFAPEEVAFVLQDCAAKALFGQNDLLFALAPETTAGLEIFSVRPPNDARPIASSASDYPAWRDRQSEYNEPEPPAPMSMIYTSGTTGRPKGVRRRPPGPEHAAALEKIRSLIYGLSPQTRALLPGPLYHSAPNAFGLRAGRYCELLVMMERFDPEAFLRLVDQEAIESVFMVPTMFIRLLKLPQEVRDRYDVSSLRHVIHAAAPCPADVKAQMIAWWGAVIWEFYGSTESGPVTFCSSQEALKKPGTVGRATSGAQLRILDGEGHEVAQGEIGEVFSRFDAYPDFTYHNDPQKRSEIDQAGFITSGDMGYLDADGYLFLCDRKRDMVISGGVNIYPVEIEAALHAMPEINDCAVFGAPDPEYGERLVALVELRDGHSLDIDDIRAFLGARLARYKIPKIIELRDQLPREDSGKIFKRRLREPYWLDAGRRI